MTAGASHHHFLEVMAARLQGFRRDRRHVAPPPTLAPATAAERPEYYTLQEAAKVARVSTKTLRNWGVPRSKPAGRVLIKRTDLEKFLEQHKLGSDDARRGGDPWPAS